VKVNEPKMLTHGRRADADDPAGLDVRDWSAAAPTDRPEIGASR